MDDTVSKIVDLKKYGDLDILKLPLKLRFKNEPGIDMGGLTREFFVLTIKDLFSPDRAMFKHNEDVQLYWFQGTSEEGKQKLFELAGSLLGLAVYNNYQIDLPLVPVLFKILMSKKPDLLDMY